MFFSIVDQNLEVKYHRYLTGSLFKNVTKKLDTGEIQILFPDAIITLSITIDMITMKVIGLWL